MNEWMVTDLSMSLPNAPLNSVCDPCYTSDYKERVSRYRTGLMRSMQSSHIDFSADSADSLFKMTMLTSSYASIPFWIIVVTRCHWYCMREIRWWTNLNSVTCRGTVILGFEQQNKYTVLDQDGNVVALLAEDGGGFGKQVGRQLLRTRRSFTATIFSPEGELSAFASLRDFPLLYLDSRWSLI